MIPEEISMTTWREAYHAELARLGPPMGVGDAAVTSRLAKAFADRETGRSADPAPAALAMDPRPQPAPAAPRHTTAEILAGLAGSYPARQKPSGNGDSSQPSAVDDDPYGWDDIVAATNAQLAPGNSKPRTSQQKVMPASATPTPPDDDDEFPWEDIVSETNARQGSTSAPSPTFADDDISWDAFFAQAKPSANTPREEVTRTLNYRYVQWRRENQPHRRPADADQDGWAEALAEANTSTAAR